VATCLLVRLLIDSAVVGFEAEMTVLLQQEVRRK
jgi:hypothetical protein